MEKKIIFCGYILFLVNCLALSSCGSNGSDDKKATAVSPIPKVTAIAKATLPDALESTAVTSLNDISMFVDSNLQTLKTRIFSPGPTDFLFRLSKVDERMSEIATQISNCENTVTATYTPPIAATGFSFPLELSCKVVIDAAANGVSDYAIYFGKSGGFWYLADIQTNAAFEAGDGEPPTMAVLAKVDVNGYTAEVYQISVEKVLGVYQSTMTHIKADKQNGIFQLSTASSAQNSTETISPGANYSGVGCGVMMKTNGSLVYATGKFDQISICPATSTICADATLASATGCTGVIDSFSLLNLTNRSVINGSLAKALIVDRAWLTGL